jgi:hypothetical protein
MAYPYIAWDNAGTSSTSYPEIYFLSSSWYSTEHYALDFRAQMFFACFHRHNERKIKIVVPDNAIPYDDDPEWSLDA